VNTIDFLEFNLKETRRRSEIVWNAIPEDKLNWKPDEDAMTCIEMVRHVLEAEHYYCLAIKNRASIENFDSPFDKRPFISIKDELDFAEPYHREFISSLQFFSSGDLENVKIDRSDEGYIRSLGDMLMRIAYHEAVHTGQLLDYLRTMDVPRPKIWD